MLCVLGAKHAYLTNVGTSWRRFWILFEIWRNLVIGHCDDFILMRALKIRNECERTLGRICFPLLVTPERFVSLRRVRLHVRMKGQKLRK